MEQAAVFHRPVLVDEVLEYLAPRTGTVVDACVGGAGHARQILSALGSGRLLGLDWDPEALAEARRRLDKYKNVELVQANYADMAVIVNQKGLAPVRGVLFDFGVSYHQLRTAGRGFSYELSGPLDMRFCPSASLPPALTLVRRASLRQIVGWLSEYGQERFAKRIARRINDQRDRLVTTRDLAELVRSAVPGKFAAKSLARVFQALRIATNRELDNVRKGLAAAVDLLAPGGRLVAISYHSLEDREVKLCLREGKRQGRLKVLTPKPVQPTEAEVRANPQARSARLRAAEKDSATRIPRYEESETGAR